MAGIACLACLVTELSMAIPAMAILPPHGPNLADETSGLQDKLFLMRSNIKERIDAQVQIPNLTDKIIRLEDPDFIKPDIDRSKLSAEKIALIEREVARHRLHILATFLYRRGTLLAVLGDNEKAMSDLGAALNSDSNYAPAYNNRACLKASEGDFDGALADANKALTLAPNFVEAYDTRGAVYLAKKQYQKARLDFDHAIAARPAYAEAFYHRALLMKALGKESDWQTDFQKAKQLGY
ncbi:MAG: hypothetical protein KGS72_05655 [Cyanobacteria bacterium REEB67]|nr:hypothetical protein [Cyanobacteria bacterium REEB67]